MVRNLLAFIAVACLLGTAYGRSLYQAAAAASAAPAEATAPAAHPTAGAAAPPATAAAAPKPANDDPAATAWQRNGYVPLPKSVAQPPAQEGPPAAPPAKATALPPANLFGSFTTDDGSAPAAATQDPTGTASVYTDPRAAPAAVQAAYAEQMSTSQSVLPSTGSSSIATATTSPAAASSGPGVLGGDVPLDAAGGGMSGSVFINQGNDFNNRYIPSVSSALSSNDVLVKMIVNAPEQQVAASGDALRSMLGGLTNTPVNNIFVYQTRTITNANGQPSLVLQLLFKNSNDAERAQVQSTFLNRDLLQGLAADVAKNLRLQIAPGSIQASNAVNDGGAALPTAMPGTVPGAVPFMGANGSFMPGAFGVNGAAAATPAAQPPANAAEARVVTDAAMLVALLVATLAML